MKSLREIVRLGAIFYDVFPYRIASSQPGVKKKLCRKLSSVSGWFDQAPVTKDTCLMEKGGPRGGGLLGSIASIRIGSRRKKSCRKLSSVSGWFGQAPATKDTCLMDLLNPKRGGGYWELCPALGQAVEKKICRKLSSVSDGFWLGSGDKGHLLNGQGRTQGGGLLGSIASIRIASRKEIMSEALFLL